jgi:hypothetical protein
MVPVTGWEEDRGMAALDPTEGLGSRAGVRSQDSRDACALSTFSRSVMLVERSTEKSFCAGRPT